jgi:acyl carrier protein
MNENVGQIAAIELAIESIWRDVLKRDVIEHTANFYEVGGDSLTAIKVFSRLRRDFELTLPLNLLLKALTISQQAQLVLESTTVNPG